MIIDDFSNPKRKLTVSEASAANDYFTRRKSEEDRIAGIKAPAKNKKNPANTDYAKKRKQQDVDESRPFRGTGGSFNRGDDERHDLDPSDWYIVKDGKMFAASIYPRQVQQAIAQGFSRTKQEARAKASSEGVAEGLFDQFRKKQQNYGGIDVSVEKEDNNILVKATANGRELGRVLFTPSEQDDNLLVPLDLEVDERYRGQGIGATMYDYVKSLGYTIRRSQYQTDAGAGFWDKHKSGKNVWEQGVAEGIWERHNSIPELEDAIKNLIDAYKGGVNLTDKGRAQLLLSINKGKRILAKKKQQQQGMVEGYPKHQDLSGISTDKLKAYLDKQSKQQVSGEGNQVKRVRAELQRREQGVAEGKESPEKEIERLKLRQDAEHGHAPLRRQAATQARIRELEKQIKGKQGVAEGVSLKQKHEDKKQADQNQVRYGKMTQAEFDKKWTRTERPKPTDKEQGVAEGSLEEVSQDTARSYAQKARASQKDLINQTHRKGADTDALNKKIKNRQQGMDRAHTDKRYYKDEQGVAEGEYDSRKPFGVRYKVFAGREGRVTTKEYWTTSEEKLQKAVDKIQALDNFYEIDGYSYPKESQGVTEVFADQGSGSTDRDNAEYMKRRKAAKFNKSAKPSKPKNQQEYDAIEKYRKDLAQTYNKPKKEQGVAEAKNLKKRVKIVKGPDAGKTGWIREIKHGAFKGAPKSYYLDLDDGGQANNLPGAALRLIKDQSLSENAEDLHVGDPVIITGNGIKFEGATGEIVDFGRDNRFVVVNLYNHGRHSFHSSDVSFNEYAGSDDEEARMYDAGEFGDDYRDEMDEARTSAAQRLSNAWDRQRAKSNASLARTPSSIPKKEEPKKADPVPKTVSEHRTQRRALMAQMLNSH